MIEKISLKRLKMGPEGCGVVVDADGMCVCVHACLHARVCVGTEHSRPGVGIWHLRRL